jgi:hypothetical protein
MGTAKDIDKEMLPIWAAFHVLCWQKNCESGIRPTVAEPEKTVLQNRPIY